MFKTAKFLKTPFFFLLLVGTLFVTSCEKEVEQPDDPNMEIMTDEEAVLLVEAALTTEADGLEAETAMALDLVEEMNENTASLNCGLTQDSTIIRSQSGQFFSFNNTSDLSWTANCTPNGLLQSLDFNRISTGSYSGPRLSGNDSSNGSWTLSNILVGTQYLFDGAYSRMGNTLYEGRNQDRSLSTTIEFELSDLAVNKGSRRIDSGSANFTITGETGQGQTFEIDGVAVFLGEGAITVIINGIQYDIQI